MASHRKEAFIEEFTYWARQALAELNLSISQEKWTQFVRYFALLKEMGEPLGLTALKTPKDYALKHFIDSLTVIPYLPPGPLLDLGTGAGLPGVIIKIMQPEREVWLVDARKKAVSFLTYVAGVLKLEKLKIIQAKVGQNDPLPRKYFAVVVCRAVKELLTLWKLSAPLVRPGGQLIAMKGPKVEEEIGKFKKTFPDLSVETHPLKLPLSQDPRTIVVIKASPSLGN